MQQFVVGLTGDQPKADGQLTIVAVLIQRNLKAALCSTSVLTRQNCTDSIWQRLHEEREARRLIGLKAIRLKILSQSNIALIPKVDTLAVETLRDAGYKVFSSHDRRRANDDLPDW